MSLLLGLYITLSKVLCGWWSKGNLEFRFGPNLGLRLEAGTKLNNATKLLMGMPPIWNLVGPESIPLVNVRLHQKYCAQ